MISVMKLSLLQIFSYNRDCLNVINYLTEPHQLQNTFKSDCKAGNFGIGYCKAIGGGNFCVLFSFLYVVSFFRRIEKNRENISHRYLVPLI
jgi:hypothetical protein